MYVLGLPSGSLAEHDRDQIIRDVESWLIRRLVCQLTNKNYNKFFVSLLTKVKTAKHSVSAQSVGNETSGQIGETVSRAILGAVREELLRSADDTVRWPKDEEFEAGWLEKVVYVKSRPDRAVMLLRAIDADMMNSKNEAIALPDNLTVEHLLPQQGSLLDYPYPTDGVLAGAETPKSRRDRIIHTVGNLTLLTFGLNSSVSNGPFANKRPSIAENSALRLNSFFQNPQKTDWSELDIIERGRDLFKHAKNVWPFAP